MIDKATGKKIHLYEVPFMFGDFEELWRCRYCQRLTRKLISAVYAMHCFKAEFATELDEDFDAYFQRYLTIDLVKDKQHHTELRDTLLANEYSGRKHIDCLGCRVTANHLAALLLFFDQLAIDLDIDLVTATEDLLSMDAEGYQQAVAYIAGWVGTTIQRVVVGDEQID